MRNSILLEKIFSYEEFKMTIKSLVRILFPIFIFLVAMTLIVFPYITKDNMPGNLGDARLNSYILENFYLSLVGKSENFIDAGYFYPWVKTIHFSDTHWGSAFIYSIFRLCKSSPEDAFRLWFFMGFVINYWSVFFVNRVLGLKVTGATLGAFVFTFSLPVLAKIGHAQLLYRACVPFAFLFFYEFLKKGDLRYLGATFTFVSLQLLVTMYIGVFLIYLLSAYFVVWCFFSNKAMFIREFSIKNQKWIYVVLLFVVGFIFFAIFAIPYYEAQHLYGFKRSWLEISLMLPRITSYFLSDHSMMWISKYFDLGIPMRHEHQMFIGIGALSLLIYALCSKKFFKHNVLAMQSAGIIFLMAIFTLYIHNFSIYKIVSHVPGLTSVRAVSRIILVMIFPISVILGLSIDYFLSKKDSIINKLGIILLFFSLILVDSILFTPNLSKKRDWLNSEKVFSSRVIGSINKDSIIISAVKNPYIVNNLDVMIYAHRHGIKTMNGYSGNAPPGYVEMKTCADVLHNINTAQKFYREKLHKNFEINKDNIIYVGFDTDCKKIN